MRGRVARFLFRFRDCAYVGMGNWILEVLYGWSGSGAGA